MRWVGEQDWDLVADHAAALLQRRAANSMRDFRDGIRADSAVHKTATFYWLNRMAVPLGTATSLPSLAMWVRGGRVPCQGVAWVGTIKTHRRGARVPGDGIASRIMRETLRLGRERGQVVSALMPFRGSYYEHFGYGIVERRCTWTVPLAAVAGRGV